MAADGGALDRIAAGPRSVAPAAGIRDRAVRGTCHPPSLTRPDPGPSDEGGQRRRLFSDVQAAARWLSMPMPYCGNASTRTRTCGENGSNTGDYPRSANRRPVARQARRFSIDELPQILNVVCGRMALVGPRPLPVEVAAGMRPDDRKCRQTVLPGITGCGRSPAAVSYRSTQWAAWTACTFASERYCAMSAYCFARRGP